MIKNRVDLCRSAGVFALVFSLSLLAGCATLGYPPVPDYQIEPQARVGFYIDGIGGNPIHSHVGTTIFNNFTKMYDQIWPLEEHAIASLKAEAVRHSLVAVDLRGAGLDGEVLAALMTTSSEGWEYTPEGADLAARIVDEHRLDAVVVMRGLERHQVTYICGYGGCQSTSAEGMGVLSRGMFGHLNFSAVPAIAMQVYVLEPRVNLARYGALAEQLRVNQNTVNLRGKVERPDDLKELDEDLLATVREALEQRIEELIDSVFEMLMNPAT